MKTYIIEYTLYFADNSSIDKTTKVHKCMSELHAKVKLGDYLKRKYIDYSRLVIHSCVESNFFTDFFGNIFNDKNNG